MTWTAECNDPSDYEEEVLDYLEGGSQTRSCGGGPANLVKLSRSLSRLEQGEIDGAEAVRLTQTVMRTARQAHSVLASTLSTELLNDALLAERCYAEEATSNLCLLIAALEDYQACLKAGDPGDARQQFARVAEAMESMDYLYEYNKARSGLEDGSGRSEP